MWKDFFYFSKSERRAILFLLTLLFVLAGMWIFFSDEGSQSVDTDKEEGEDIKKFLADVHEMEQKKFPDYVYKKPKKRKPVLVSFDPNLADSIELLQLGLPSFIARNIIKYRRAGGKFRTPEDFSRIYGLTAGQFKTLEPYISISEEFQQKPDTMYYAEKVQKDTLVFYKYPEGTLVDLNEADTTELKKIPGIGSGIAKMIVGYRRRLGGFYDIAQLKEIKYINEDMLGWFKLGDTPIRQINGNTAGLDKLRSHPYINFYQAKVIIEYRRNKGKLKSLSQISLYEEFTEKDLERLSHYLVFD